MRLTRVHVDAQLATGMQLALPAGPAQHLTRVLRLEAGAPLVVFNGRGGEFAATIESVKRDQVAVRIGAHAVAESESPLQVSLLQGIARGEKMDLILQKATELGVSRVVPLTSARSNVRLHADTSARKQEHWRGVVIGACEQSGRNRVPEVAAASPLPSAVAAEQADLKLVLAPDETALSLNALLAARRGGRPSSACLLVGPEGGFDPDEVRIAELAGFVRCRLGPRVLRTETAGLVALTVLQFACGDLG